MRLAGALCILGMTLTFSASAGVIFNDIATTGVGPGYTSGSGLVPGGGTPYGGAQEIISATGSDPNGDSAAGPIYASFLSSNNITGSTLTGLEFSLFAGSNTDGGSVNVELYANNAGQPGAPIASLGTILDSALNNCTGDTTTDACSNPSSASIVSPTGLGSTLGNELAQSTEYWIGLSQGPNGTSALWNFEGDDSGVGVAGQCWQNQTYSYSAPNNCGLAGANAGNTFNNSDGAMMMQVATADNEIPSGTIPEPATFLLFGSAALAVGMFRRRSRS